MAPIPCKDEASSKGPDIDEAMRRASSDIGTVVGLSSRIHLAVEARANITARISHLVPAGEAHNRIQDHYALLLSMGLLVCSNAIKYQLCENLIKMVL